MIKFANRVGVCSASEGRLFWTHSERAREMYKAGQVELENSLARKVTKGRDVYVTQIFLADRNPKSEESRGANSSKTTFVQLFAVVRRNERGEPIPGAHVTLASIQQHKPISDRIADLYGRRVERRSARKGVKR